MIYFLGCVGTVAWKIGNTGKMVVVMYSVPYSRDFHSNWCGVGIFYEEDTSEYFDKMYYGSIDNFARKDFYNDTNTVRYEDDSDWEISATMATNHTPDIQVMHRVFNPR